MDPGILGTDPEDWFIVYLDAGTTVYINMTVPVLSDYDLYLYDSSGVLLDESVLFGSLNEAIEHQITTSDWYYVQVYGNYGGGRYTLTIEVT